EDGIRDLIVTGVQTCALPISLVPSDQRRRYYDGFHLREPRLHLTEGAEWTLENADTASRAHNYQKSEYRSGAPVTKSVSRCDAYGGPVRWSRRESDVQVTQVGGRCDVESPDKDVTGGSPATGS